MFLSVPLCRSPLQLLCPVIFQGSQGSDLSLGFIKSLCFLTLLLEFSLICVEAQRVFPSGVHSVNEPTEGILYSVAILFYI